MDVIQTRYNRFGRADTLRLEARLANIDSRLGADLSLREAHDIATTLETALQNRFGKETIANLHLEPYSA